LASSETILSQDEKELGVALIDIGGGTTDIAVFAEGSIKHTAVLPLGGNYVTSDISVGLRTPVLEAEKIKIRYGSTYTPQIPPNENIEVPSVGGRNPRTVSRQVLGEIIEPRMEEILSLAQREIVKSGYDDLLTAGVVLTGGTATLEGITELAEQIFNTPVRKGYPVGVGGITDIVNNPMYATGVGLVVRGSKDRSGYNVKRNENSMFSGIRKKLERWFNDFF